MAAPYTVTVNGTSMPWQWVVGGKNTSLQFGLNDGTAPIVALKDVPLGAVVTLTYSSGTAKASAARSLYDANGDTTSPSPVNGNLGPTSTYYPSKYFSSSDYPVNLLALVGCWTDVNGNVIGTPFKVGDGPTTVTCPQGGAQLQLGANDDQYSDNSGSWVVRVMMGACNTIGTSGTSRSTGLVIWGTGGSGSGGGNTTGVGQVFPTGIN